MYHTLYSTNGHHRLTSANYVTYVTGELHPDRVMDDLDLIYMIDGEWEIWMEEEAYLLRPGEVLLLAPHRHHYGKRPCQAQTKTMYLHVRVDENGQKLSLPAQLDCRQQPYVRTLFAHIVALHHEPQTPSKDAKLSALLNLLFCELYDVQNAALSLDETTVAKAKQLFERRPEYMYSLSELTGLLEISSKTLNKRFRRATGQTACQYQMDFKLEMVRTFLLEHPNIPLRSVAQNYGFYDEFYLSRMFKKKYGIPPSKIRP